MSASPAVIDSHLHVWDRHGGDYTWIPPGPLDRTFTVADAAPELRAAGIDAAVLVQAADTEADTRSMLAAAADPLVVGVVGWVRLDDTDTAARQLEAYGAGLCGVRHLVHDDPRDGFLDLPEVRRSLGLLAERRLPLDVPDAWPRHLHRLPALADALPELTVVVDHLGKPPRGSAEFDTWAAALREVARRPNVVAKVSGLQRADQPFTVDALRPTWEVALGAFGPERLMYGGDWPMTVPHGGYVAHWRIVRTLLDELAPVERDRVLQGTATSVYGLRLPEVGR